MEPQASPLPRPAWVNEIVLNRYSSLSRAQQDEIWGEFHVWATTRGIRKAQAKRHGLDESIKTLSLHGNHNNFDAAFAKAMMFIDRNGKEGVAKDKHLQDALRQKAREKAAMRKAEVRAAMREAQENCQQHQHKFQKLQPKRPSVDDLWYMQTWAFWDQSGWWDSSWSCNQPEWQLEEPPGLQVPSYDLNSQGQYQELYEYFEYFQLGVDKDVSEKSQAGESTESICGGLGSGLSEDKNLLWRWNDGEPASSNQGCILEKQKNKYADSSCDMWWEPRKVDLKGTHNHWHNPKVTQEIAEDESETVADRGAYPALPASLELINVNLEEPMIEDPGQEWLASDHSVKKAEDSEQGALTLINENAKEPTFEDDADKKVKNIKEPTFEDDAHEEADDSEQKALPLTYVNVKEPLLAHDTDDEQVVALTDPYFEEF